MVCDLFCCGLLAPPDLIFRCSKHSVISPWSMLVMKRTNNVHNPADARVAVTSGHLRRFGVLDLVALMLPICGSASGSTALQLRTEMAGSSPNSIALHHPKDYPSSPTPQFWQGPKPSEDRAENCLSGIGNASGSLPRGPLMRCAAGATA